MWPVHVAVDVENEMMNDGGCNVSVNFQIEHQRAMTRRKMAFPNERKEEWKKNEHKSNWTTEREREKKREVSHILIYEPSLRFKGNKSDTTCLQTLKCHRSIAQLTPIGAVMSSIEEWKRKTKNKMDHNKLKFLYIGRQNDKCQVVWSLFPPFSSSSSSSAINDRLTGELSFIRALPVLYKLKYMTTKLDWCWQIALRFLVLSFSFLCLSRFARLLVKSTQALFNQISQKASLLSFFLHRCWWS